MVDLVLAQRPVPAHGPWPDAVPRVLQRVYAARGVLAPADADLSLSRLLPLTGLGSVSTATALLADAIDKDRHIVVVGDFDCDGATGTAVAVRGLRMLGATRVSYRVPHRILHGYGLSPALVEDLAQMQPDLVVTVDSGIACHAGVAAAKARGWQVLITDHHLPGAQLPAADAIVNPNLEDDGFPSKAIAGVGVMFYLLLALRGRLREAGRFGSVQPDLAALLDLVAVGTVADLVPLDFNNRLLVSAGIRRLRQGRGQPGLRALAEVAGRKLEALSAADIGFAIAPRLNAAGRLEDMSIGVECLLCDDPHRAAELARTLDGINAQRRGRQQQMLEEADLLVSGLSFSGKDLPVALSLFDSGWHPGIVGLVASRIKDQTHRPTLAFAPAEPGGTTLRGSARSIPGFHIRDALALVDARHPGLIERFGGHAMAAGLSLALDDFQRFSEAFEAVAAASLSPELLQSRLLTDGELDAGDVTRSLVDALQDAGPWGQGFPEPVFENTFTVLEWRIVGERHLKMSLRAAGSEVVLAAIHFGGFTGEPPPANIRAVYQLERDDYRDRKGVQLLIRHLHPA